MDHGRVVVSFTLVATVPVRIYEISTRSQTDTPVHTGRNSGQTTVKQTQILKQTHVRPVDMYGSMLGREGQRVLCSCLSVYLLTVVCSLSE